MIAHISPVVLRQEIGRRIRGARHGAGLTLNEAAVLLEITRSALNRLETGAVLSSVHIVRTMMDIYDQRLDEVQDMIRQARDPGWWKQYGISDKDFVALETGACRVSNYELSFVPGLLQTADYARVLFESSANARTDEWIANRLAVRLTRQERLTDEEHPLELDAVVHEFVLRHPVGGRVVMRNQLQHLALINELPTVTLRVLPASVIATEALEGAFTILDFPAAGQPSMGYVTHGMGDVRSDKSEQVEPTRLRYSRLRSLALEPDDSAALIERAADGLWSS